MFFQIFYIFFSVEKVRAVKFGEEVRCAALALYQCGRTPKLSVRFFPIQKTVKLFSCREMSVLNSNVKIIFFYENLTIKKIPTTKKTRASCLLIKELPHQCILRYSIFFPLAIATVISTVIASQFPKKSTSSRIPKISKVRNI